MNLNEINKSANEINVKGLTVNDRLYHSGLIETFDNTLINNKELAAQILTALQVDEKSIDQIVN